MIKCSARGDFMAKRVADLALKGKPVVKRFDGKGVDELREKVVNEIKRKAKDPRHAFDSAMSLYCK